jgi:hypothetical protein
VASCVSPPTSRLSAAFTKTQIAPPQKFANAAIQPSFVAIYAVEIGAIPPVRLAQVFIRPASEHLVPDHIRAKQKLILF